MDPVAVKNIFVLPASLSTEEVIEELAAGSDFRVERIVSCGQSSPAGFWYDQAQDEWVVLLQGNATLLFEDQQRVELKAGDSLIIAAHQKHRVEYTSSDPACIWIAVFGEFPNR